MAWVIGIPTFIAVGGYSTGAVDLAGSIVAFVFWLVVCLAVRVIYLNATKKGRTPPPPS